MKTNDEANAFLADHGWISRARPVEDLVFEGQAGRVLGAAFRLVSASQSLSISFPWWDWLSQARPLIDWFRTASDGQRFTDLDQGWLFEAAVVGDRIFMRDGNWEECEEFAVVSVDRATMVAAAERFIREIDARV